MFLLTTGRDASITCMNQSIYTYNLLLPTYCSRINSVKMQSFVRNQHIRNIFQFISTMYFLARSVMIVRVIYRPTVSGKYVNTHTTFRVPASKPYQLLMPTIIIKIEPWSRRLLVRRIKDKFFALLNWSAGILFNRQVHFYVLQTVALTARLSDCNIFVLNFGGYLYFLGYHLGFAIVLNQC